MTSDCGLTISEEEFLKLPQKQQLLLIFKNQVMNKDLYITNKLHQKIQYVWLGVITAAGTWILTKYGSLVFTIFMPIVALGLLTCL